MNPLDQRNAFRAAIERQVHPALLQAFTPDVVFHSPIVHQPYVGRAALAPILAAITQVFREFHYLEGYSSTNGKVLLFHARVGQRELDGVDILTFDAIGHVQEFSVMVRSYSAATVLREIIAAHLARGN